MGSASSPKALPLRAIGPRAFPVEGDFDVVPVRAADGDSCFYIRVLDQRNRLLKDMAYETSLFNTLDIWDERLASFAAVVIKTRASFLERLKPFSQDCAGFLP